MTLLELLELMQEIAKLNRCRVCLGIQVKADGSGRTTPGTVDDGTEISVCEFGPTKVEWRDIHEGNLHLIRALNDKLKGERGDHNRQITIGSFTQFD